MLRDADSEHWPAKPIKAFGNREGGCTAGNLCNVFGIRIWGLSVRFTVYWHLSTLSNNTPYLSVSTCNKDEVIQARCCCISYLYACLLFTGFPFLLSVPIFGSGRVWESEVWARWRRLWRHSEKRRYSSTYSSPRHCMDVNDQLHSPVALATGNITVPSGYEAGWTPETVWRLWEKNLCRLLNPPIRSQ
jgi:hypothetical protein